MALSFVIISLSLIPIKSYAVSYGNMSTFYSFNNLQNYEAYDSESKIGQFGNTISYGHSSPFSQFGLTNATHTGLDHSLAEFIFSVKDIKEKYTVIHYSEESLMIDDRFPTPQSTEEYRYFSDQQHQLSYFIGRTLDGVTTTIRYKLYITIWGTAMDGIHPISESGRDIEIELTRQIGNDIISSIYRETFDLETFDDYFAVSFESTVSKYNPDAPSRQYVLTNVNIQSSDSLSGFSAISDMFSETISDGYANTLAEIYISWIGYTVGVPKYFSSIGGVLWDAYYPILYSVFNIPYVRWLQSTVRTFPSFILDGTLFNSLALFYANQQDTNLGSYWEYTAFTLEQSESVIVTIVNFTYEFQFVKGVSQTNRYYYSSNGVSGEDLGDWGSTWNWLRNGLASVLSALMFLLNLLMYILTVALNYLVLFVCCMYIIPFLNNTILYWVLYGLVYIFINLGKWIIDWVQWVIASITWLWENVIYPVITWIWDALQAFLEFLWQDIILPIFTWIYENIIIPIWNYIVEAYQWFISDGITILINWYITFVSWVLAIIIYIFSFGSVNILVIQSSIASTITNINAMFYEFIGIFFGNFVLILSYFLTYMLEIGLVFLKKVYCQAKGYNNRAQKLQASIDVFKLPIIIPIRLVQYLLAFVGQDSAPNTE